MDDARDRVLDVAAGNGNAALAAARRGATVTASDYVPTLLEALPARGDADGLEIEARTTDAEALPFDDSTFDGQVFRVVGKYVPPPAGVRSPLEWGTEDRVAELLGEDVESLVTTRRDFVFRYRSAEQWLDTFRSFYGPMVRAFGALDDVGQRSFADDLLQLARSMNTSTSGSLRIPSHYLEIVAVRSA